ncbi:hypothetical protein MUBE_02275 [Mycobacterium uberis]|uniref:Uncharacterized protein n=1 Tax=Mycobacterium uberis TaxID=2162698 RepID=A0A3E1HK01_9MYCO|nr:hypothetical protein [Mycobacterium uberis]RFD26707.1 hypothetical protein MUBE_02275 [Mycobacterium uberis]
MRGYEPAFIRVALQGIRDMIALVTREHIALRFADADINRLDCMNVLTLDIILRLIFGITEPNIKDKLTNHLQDITNI